MSLVLEYGQARLYQDDCRTWLSQQEPQTISAVVTDPPYGLHEYTPKEQEKLRAGKGGVWRIPPSFDGHQRASLPRFSVLTSAELEQLEEFFFEWATSLRPVLFPGAHVCVASNPLVTPYLARGLARAGLRRRGEIIRLVMTMRGGDRPKNAHQEFPDLTVMPRSQFEPWLLYQEPMEKGMTVADNLRKYRVGALRRISESQPFGDVIKSSPTGVKERKIAKHPSLKPQAFLRPLVRGMLPFGEGVVLDPFAGSGSTLAAAQALGYDSVGIEADPHYVDVGVKALPVLSELAV